MKKLGFGISVKRLSSLANAKIYNIPMLATVGRLFGPCIEYKPKLVQQHKVIERLLEACDLPFIVKAFVHAAVIGMSKLDQIRGYVEKIERQSVPQLNEMKIKKGSRICIDRLAYNPVQNKALMKAFR